MAHPVLTKGFLQLSPEAAMLLGAPTHLPLSHPLKQNLSPKDITGSDIMSWKSGMACFGQEPQAAQLSSFAW